MIEVQLPQLGEDITCATVACWHVSAGEKVTTDSDIVELVTDKASFNVPSPVNGRIEEICFTEGQTAQIGEVLARISEEEKE